MGKAKTLTDIEWVKLAVSDDDARPVLTGIHFDTKRKLIEATDSYRLHVVTIDAQAEPDTVDDHAVGLCGCSTLGVLRELKLWLAGRETCHTCSGDGFVPVDDGHAGCPDCDGGSVAIGDQAPVPAIAAWENEGGRCA